MNEPSNFEEIFGRALGLSSLERSFYLDRACSGDGSLKAQVEALLRAHDDAGDFMAHAPGGDVRSKLTKTQEEEDLGLAIGRYKLLQKIGEGGCGVVYMAQQEEPVRRLVAIKVIKLGMDTKEVIARFEAERQALASMEHPNIASIFDAGATATGRPFFAMELIRGVPITKYCDEKNLPLPARLELFTQVCQAVQHAHQKGIIHRDLKPANILVTVHDGAPLPKVIDFGIAKATQGRLTDRTLFTAFEQFIGTPAYMSPEQADFSSLGVDTRSDIYSLGVLLYELLTGHVPFDPNTLAKAGIDESRRIIREIEPPKPSARISTLTRAERIDTAQLRGTEAAHLSAFLRDDLDWIVMRCLEKDRRRRYDTASALAEDLLRHLRSQPVTARAPSGLYILQRLFRRHRLAFVSAGAISIALLLGLGFFTWAFLKEKVARERAITAERRAKTQAEKSDQVARLLKEMLESVGPYVAQGRDTSLLREILDKTAIRIGRDLNDQPEVEAELRISIGLVYKQLAEFEKAEVMFRTAANLRQSAGGLDDPAAVSLLLNIADCMVSRGDLAGGDALLKEAVSRENKYELSASLRDEPFKARQKVTRGQFLTDVQVIQQRLLEAQRKVTGSDDPIVTKTLNNIGGVALEQGELTQAEAMLRETLAEQRKQFGNEHREIALTLMNLGAISFSRGQYDAAEKTWREGLSMQQKLLGRDHPDVAQMQMNLTGVLIIQRRFAEGESTAREALALQRKLFPPDHPNVAMALGNLGAVLAEEGEISAAEAIFREALTASRKSEQTVLVATGLNNLTDALQKQGRWREAEDYAREALVIWEHLDSDAWQIFSTRFQIGLSLAGEKKYAAAEPLLLAGYEGMESREQSMRPDERAANVTSAVGHLAQFYTDLKQPEKACAWQSKLAIRDKATSVVPASGK